MSKEKSSAEMEVTGDVEISVGRRVGERKEIHRSL